MYLSYANKSRKNDSKARHEKRRSTNVTQLFRTRTIYFSGWKNENPPVWAELAEEYQSKFEDYEIVIIDECSMVEKKFHDLIANCDRVVVWSGDSMQLPPIGETDDWSIFDQKEYLSTTLTKNLRAKNTEQEDLCAKVRLDPLTFAQVGAKDIPYPRDAPILCFHNYRVDEYNRLHMAPGTEDRPVVGSKIIFCSGALPASSGDGNHQSELYSGAIYKVHSVYDKRFECFGKKWTCLVLRVQCEESDNSYCSVYCIARGDRKCFKIERDASIKNQAERISKLETELKNLKSEPVKDEDQIENTEEEIEKCWIQRRQVQRDYRRYANKWLYAYAITVHKAQGSTFQFAVIDINDVITSAIVGGSDYFHKMLYTAVTRGAHGCIAIKKDNEGWRPFPPKVLNIQHCATKIDKEQKSIPLAKQIANKTIRFLLYINGKERETQSILCGIRSDDPLKFVALDELIKSRETIFLPGSLIGVYPNKNLQFIDSKSWNAITEIEVRYEVEWVTVRQLKRMLNAIRVETAGQKDQINPYNVTDLYDKEESLDLINNQSLSV